MGFTRLASPPERSRTTKGGERVEFHPEEDALCAEVYKVAERAGESIVESGRIPKLGVRGYWWIVQRERWPKSRWKKLQFECPKCGDIMSKYQAENESGEVTTHALCDEVTRCQASGRFDSGERPRPEARGTRMTVGRL